MFFRFLHNTFLIIVLICSSSYSADDMDDRFDMQSLSVDKLKDIASEIFFRDKDKPYTKIKMCTHSSRAVEEWKNYVQPSTKGIEKSHWRSMLQRQSIVVFNESNEEAILNHVADLMKSKENFEVLLKKMRGDASNTLVIQVIVHSENSGIKYSDQDVSKKRSKKSSQEYTETTLNKIKILIDVSSIFKEKGHIDSILNLGSIKTICPSE